MNTKLINSLVIVALVLSSLIATEWFFAKKARKKLLNSENIAVKPMALDEMPSINLQKQNEGSYVDLVNRPLFIKGRRPVDEPATPEEAQAEDLANNFDWQLNGIYTTRKGLMVLVSRDKVKVPHDNYRKITKGSDLSGWKLTRILADRVVLKQGETKKEMLLRKPKSKTPVNGLISPPPQLPQLPLPPNTMPGMAQPQEGSPGIIPTPPQGMMPGNPQAPIMAPEATQAPSMIPAPTPEPVENIENNNNAHF